MVGGLSTLLQYLVLFTLLELCRADAILASSVGFAVSALLNYGLNYRLAFHSDRPAALCDRRPGRLQLNGDHAWQRLAQPALSRRSGHRHAAGALHMEFRRQQSHGMPPVWAA